MIFHCTAFGVDNTNTNIKAKNSIKSRVRALNPTVYFVECPCHIIQNAAQKGYSNGSRCVVRSNFSDSYTYKYFK